MPKAIHARMGNSLLCVLADTKLLVVKRILGAKLRDFGADIVCRVLEIGCRELNEVRNYLHILGSEASRCNGGSTYADTRRYERRLRLVGDRVLVNGDVYLVKSSLKLLTCDVH